MKDLVNYRLKCIGPELREGQIARPSLIKDEAAI